MEREASHYRKDAEGEAQSLVIKWRLECRTLGKRLMFSKPQFPPLTLRVKAIV